MTVWNFNSISNDFTPLTYMNEQDRKARIFLTDGKPKNWPLPPQIQAIIEKGCKAPLPLADISYIVPGAIILNQKAYQVLHDVLAPFGQLLAVEYIKHGDLLTQPDKFSETFYFYNVTNIVDCIDAQASAELGAGVHDVAFVAEAIPQDCQIFKDPRRIRTQIYLSEVAKEKLCQLIAAAGLTGAVIEPAGQ